MSILAMAANAARVTGRSSPNSNAKWCKPEPRQVKINVDASFTLTYMLVQLVQLLGIIRGVLLLQKLFIFHMWHHRLWRKQSQCVKDYL
jgi:hypothetical protein